MKKYLFLGLIASLLLTSCSNDNWNNSHEGNNDNKQEGCLEPENPYSNNWGHNAGFKWAEEKNTTSCDGNSESFNDWCEEYRRQLEKYNICMEKQKK